MEEVNHKVRWEVHRRVGKPIPHPHPGWRIRATANVMCEIIDSMEEQLYEDAKWKE